MVPTLLFPLNFQVFIWVGDECSDDDYRTAFHLCVSKELKTRSFSWKCCLIFFFLPPYFNFFDTLFFARWSSTSTWTILCNTER